MGGWIIIYEDLEKEVWECAMCSNKNHTITHYKSTGNDIYGE
jgi:hypothetical protein